jgi:hypothetical protein
MELKEDLPNSYKIRRFLFNRCRTSYAVQMLKNDYKSKEGMVCAELGVNLGNYSRTMFWALEIKKLYLIDPYEIYFQNGKKITSSLGNKKIAQKTLKKFSDKIVFIEKKSLDAFDDVIDELDYVYYDIASVDYDSLYYNLNLWIKKIKTGGFISGRNFHSNCIDSARAIIDFIDTNNVEFGGVSNEWWIKKL